MDRSGIRGRVINVLLNTRQATADLTEEQIKKAAKVMGVRTSTLIEARNAQKRRKFIESKIKTNRILEPGSSRNDRLPLFMSRACKAKLWLRFSQRGVEQAVLLRSAIHHYLIRTWEPPEVSPQWILDGRTYLTPQHSSGDLVHIKSSLTSAAILALKYRAKRLRVKYKFLARQLMLSMYNGEFARPGELKYVGTEGMYTNVGEYLAHISNTDPRFQKVRKPVDEDDGVF